MKSFIQKIIRFIKKEWFLLIMVFIIAIIFILFDVSAGPAFKVDGRLI